MQAFEYRAATAAGKLVEGTAWASSEEQLDGQLDAKGLLLTDAKALGDRRPARRVRLPHADLVNLTNQLATVTGAGVPIVEGLRGIGERLESSDARLLVREMVTALEAGESLSAVLGNYPRTFPGVYRSSVSAGEESGALELVLQRVAKHLEWVRGMRATTVQALIYPLILLAAVVGLILILMYFVLPRILGMFPGGPEDLPAQTRFVLAISNFLREQWLLVAGGSAATAITFGVATRRERGRLILHRTLLGIPRFGKIASQIATTKFACTAGILHAAGCDVFTVLELASSTCGNTAMSDAYHRATERVRRGTPISEAFEQEPLIDPLLIQMVGVGEKSGRLDDCLERLVEHYDEEVPRSVKRFLSLLEPTMLVGAGVVVAFILLAALLPVFELYESIG
ncbi:MAG: type II secretion system F family protein [Planctomycetota bacterium]